jgi:surfeit locus 1 family protein
MKPIIAKIAIFSSVLILLGLGFWQLQRMSYKNNIIANLEEKLSLPTELITEVESIEKAYRKVRICGHYSDKEELFVYYKPNYIILAPFSIENSHQSIIVARGILKPNQEHKNPHHSHVCITGMLVPSERKPLFMPESNGTKTKPLLSIHLDSISKILSLELSEMYLLLIPSDDNTGLENLKIPNPTGIYNPHIGYAITWFVLAFILVFMVVVNMLLKKQS